MKPQGTLRPQMPAKFTFTVNTSPRYICTGSDVFSPTRNAGVGVTGPRIASHRANARSKSPRISVRTFCARR